MFHGDYQVDRLSLFPIPDSEMEGPVVKVENGLGGMVKRRGAVDPDGLQIVGDPIQHLPPADASAHLVAGPVASDVEVEFERVGWWWWRAGRGVVVGAEIGGQPVSFGLVADVT
jgi:hypothetical protein